MYRGGNQQKIIHRGFRNISRLYQARKMYKNDNYTGYNRSG